MNIKYFEVPILIEGTTKSAIFYQDFQGFDLDSGWDRYTKQMHDTLEGAISDFLEHLRAEQTGKEISAGEPTEIPKSKVYPSTEHI